MLLRFYDRLFAGLMRLCEQTEYKEISGFVSAWGIGFILELNIVGVLGMLNLGSAWARPVILIPLFLVLTTLAYKYYQKNSTRINALKTSFDTSNPNLSRAEMIALLFLAESVMFPLIVALARAA